MILTSFDDDNGKSITTQLSRRYEVGKARGSKDNISGNEHNDGCPSEDRHILYCIGYEIGYNDGYYRNFLAYSFRYPIYDDIARKQIPAINKYENIVDAKNADITII